MVDNNPKLKNCTVFNTVDFIGKRWTLAILHELYKANGKRRYSELQKCLCNITPKVLSLRLKELSKLGLVTKKVEYDQVPIKCTYALTKSGKDFIKIIKEIKQWALRWNAKNELCFDSKCRYCKR